jgi:hypothetical protein
MLAEDGAMVAKAEPMPPPVRDPTATAALARVARQERGGRLEVSIADRCGGALIEAFARVARAYYAAGR